VGVPSPQGTYNHAFQTDGKRRGSTKGDGEERWMGGAEGGDRAAQILGVRAEG
jgi:hypothetical protein